MVITIVVSSLVTIVGGYAIYKGVCWYNQRASNIAAKKEAEIKAKAFAIHAEERFQAKLKKVEANAIASANETDIFGEAKRIIQHATAVVTPRAKTSGLNFRQDTCIPVAPVMPARRQEYINLEEPAKRPTRSVAAARTRKKVESVKLESWADNREEREVAREARITTRKARKGYNPNRSNVRFPGGDHY